jgi:hypothetical protein
VNGGRWERLRRGQGSVGPVPPRRSTGLLARSRAIPTGVGCVAVEARPAAPGPRGHRPPRGAPGAGRGSSAKGRGGRSRAGGRPAPRGRRTSTAPRHRARHRARAEAIRDRSGPSSEATSGPRTAASRGLLLRSRQAVTPICLVTPMNAPGATPGACVVLSAKPGSGPRRYQWRGAVSVPIHTRGDDRDESLQASDQGASLPRVSERD